MSKYYDGKAKQQPDIKVADQVMLNAKNIRTKQPAKKLSPKLYGHFKVLGKWGNRAFKLEISPRWKIHLIFHVFMLEPYRQSVRPGREQPPREPEEINGDLEWEVECIVKSEIITYVRRRRRMQQIRYFVKWAGCWEDENTWEPQESLENAQEMVEEFHRENPKRPKLGWGWMTKKRFSLRYAKNTARFFTLLSRVHKRYYKCKGKNGAWGQDHIGGSSC